MTKLESDFSEIEASDKATSAYKSFLAKMENRAYGPIETATAWRWFKEGWNRRAAGKCENGKCPACNDGPSGEWFEGSEVTCDGCGAELVVDTVEECHGKSTFSLIERPDPL